MVTVLAKFSYVLSHYAVFGAFLCAFWGLGQCVLRRLFRCELDDAVLSAALSVATGQGVFIVLLQCLAVGGVLRETWLIVLLADAGLLAIIEWRSVRFHPLANLKLSWAGLSKSEIYGLGLISIFAFPTLLEPLHPPLPGDELLYHLPHAQQWAQSGSLTVNEWLRYPWFPFNFNLLFAGAYVIHGDVFTHFFNALAGWLIAIMIYRLGTRHFSQSGGCVATFIWLQLNRGEFGKGNLDMGVTLYILAASFTFYLWLQTPRDRRWLAISAFLMGVAVGSKYQALLFVPIFGLALLWIDRRLSTIGLASVSLFLPCVYWYARNAILTGDPFDPMGGKVFGFTDWNLDDYAYQFEDLKRVAAWPHLLVWPALLSLWRLRQPKLSLHVAATVLCACYFLVWLASSHYPRYLMPVVPWLALLAAEKWSDAFKFVGQRLGSVVSQDKLPVWVNFSWISALLVVTLSSASSTHKYWSYISPTTEARNALLRKEIKGYAVLEYLYQHPMGRIYNYSLTDAVYYAPHPIWGDHFGPWRYRDIVSGDPVRFADELRKRNFDSVIVAESMGWALESNPLFQQNFSIAFESDGIKLYRVEKR